MKQELGSSTTLISRTPRRRWQKMSAQVVNSAIAALKFANFPEPWLQIETVSR